MEKRKIRVEIPVTSTRIDNYETTRTDEEIIEDFKEAGFMGCDLNEEHYTFIYSDIEALSEEDDFRYPTLVVDNKTNKTIIESK